MFHLVLGGRVTNFPQAVLLVGGHYFKKKSRFPRNILYFNGNLPYTTIYNIIMYLYLAVFMNSSHLGVILVAKRIRTFSIWGCVDFVGNDEEV